MPYTSRIPAIIAEISVGVPRVIERTGLRIEAGAKQRARYHTGYMRGEIRWRKGEEPVSFKTGDNSEDDNLNWKDCDEYSGYVAGGADYTIYNEYGTVKMPAQPMFVPATEEARSPFNAELAMVMKKAT